MPVVDQVSVDYADEVTFVAVAWKGSLEDTANRADELLPSGVVQWGLDEAEAVFEAYGVPYQPVTVLVGADKTIVDSWPGARSETEIRTALDTLLAG